MKISLLTLYYLFVEIAFLFPRGYGEYSEIYHLIMTLLVWSAVMLITITEIPKIIKHSKRVSSNSKMIAAYAENEIETFRQTKAEKEKELAVVQEKLQQKKQIAGNTEVLLTVDNLLQYVKKIEVDRRKITYTEFVF